MKNSFLLTIVLFLSSAHLPSNAEFKILGNLAPDSTESTLRINHPEKIDIGYQYKYLKNNLPGHSTLTSVSKKGMTWINDKGCIHTTLVQFAVPCLWKHCAPFENGTSKTIFHGSIWPLFIGKTFSISADFDDHQQTRYCSVESAHKVTSDLGITNTLKISCKDLSNKLTWFLSIPDGRTIFHEHSNSYYNFTNHYETTN